MIRAKKIRTGGLALSDETFYCYRTGWLIQISQSKTSPYLTVLSLRRKTCHLNKMTIPFARYNRISFNQNTLFICTRKSLKDLHIAYTLSKKNELNSRVGFMPSRREASKYISVFDGIVNQPNSMQRHTPISLLLEITHPLLLFTSRGTDQSNIISIIRFSVFISSIIL